MTEKTKLSNGLDKTVTWVWLENAQLKVEYYDFSEAAQQMFGNDIAYTITVNEMSELISLSDQSETTLIDWITRKFKSYFDIKKWLEENRIHFEIERESRA